MILKIRLSGEVEWQIWDSIERLRYKRISLVEVKKIKADYNMIRMEGHEPEGRKEFASDRQGIYISMVHKGRGVTITSNSLYIFLLNDEGRTIERI